jgi:ribosome-binding protein aMBF1 (putative translation factor)
MTATATSRKRIALKQALAFLNLAPKQLAYLEELRDLFQKSHDKDERNEILEAFMEIVCPDGIEEEGGMDDGVSEDTKSRVNDYHQRVGDQIRKRRIAKGLTQTALAKKAGIPQSHVSRLEAGQHTPTHVTIKKLAKALNTQPRMLDPGFDS